MKKLALLALAALAASPLAAQRGAAPFTVEETGQGFGHLQEAVAAIGSGDGTIQIAPGTYRQCAVQTAGRVAYVATEPGSVVFDGTVCEGKAALVLRGREASVEGLTFQNMRVRDGNGAGIRIEKGNLSVSESMFRDSESGILSAADAGGKIRVEQSTFSGLGRCDRGLSCAHSIYIGEYGALSVVRSRFERGTGGHYVKSRAPMIEVSDSSFDDTGGHATNYMIDLSIGARGRIAGNRFVQGRDKENYSAFIMVAAEGHKNSADGLAVSGNDARLAPGVEHPTSFVADASGDSIALDGNRLGARIRAFERR
jgi:hypothetical protein